MRLDELAEESGVPARTIRFYISRGLVPGPDGGGRGAEYGDRHLERLAEIRNLQGKGLTLNEVARELDPNRVRLPEATACWRYPIAEDVVVEVRAGTSPWRLRQIHGALEALAARLKGDRNE